MAKSSLHNKPIAITGAGTGIGRATAIACARAGMPVALGARRLDKLNETKQAIEAIGGKAICVQMDVTSTDDCQRFVDKAVAEYGSLYSVFANAGYGLEKSIETTSDHVFRDIFEVNFWGTLNTIRPALVHMLEHDHGSNPKNRRGHILLCASAIGKIGIPYYGAYCATKAAQSIIGRSMHHELRSKGVAVSTVHPVLTKTEFAAVSQQKSNTDTRLADTMPSALMQTPEKVARAVVRCLIKPRTEVWTAFPTRWIFGLLNASPRLADVGLHRFAMPKSDTDNIEAE